MKSVIFLSCLFVTCFSLAQQSPSPYMGNTVFDYSLASSNSSKPSLNMDFFKLEGFKQNTHSLTESPRESKNQQVKPAGNMPVFMPNGRFFIETYDVDEAIDYKLQVFDLKKSKKG